MEGKRENQPDHQPPASQDDVKQHRNETSEGDKSVFGKAKDAAHGVAQKASHLVDAGARLVLPVVVGATSVMGAGIIERHDAAKTPARDKTELAVRADSPHVRQADTVSAPPQRADTVSAPPQRADTVSAPPQRADTAQQSRDEIQEPADDSTPGDDLNDAEPVESSKNKDLIIRPE